MFNLGRILTGLATLAAVLGGVALGAPALVDWDYLRAPAEAQARALLDVPVRVDGRITVQLLPSPVVSLGDVVVEPDAGSALSGNCARARVRLALWPLFSGKAVPAALSCSGADLLVDRDAIADGAAVGNLTLPVTVTEGVLRFAAGGQAEFTGVRFQARPGRSGNTRIRASGFFEEKPFSVRAVLGGAGAAALRSAALNFGEGEAVLSLVRPESSAGGADIRLKLTRGEQAAAFLGRLFPSVALVMRPEQVQRLAPLALVMKTIPEDNGFALRGLEITAGPLRLTGEGRFRPGSRPGLDLELGARTLVLGRGEGGFDPSGLLRVLGYVAEWGGEFDGGLRLHAEHVLAGGAVLRNGEIRLTFAGEGARLDRFRVSLPRGLSVSGSGMAAGPGELAAAVRLEGAQVRHLSALSDAAGPGDTGGEVPLTAEGQLILSGARAQFNQVRIAAGRNVVRGDGALFFGERTAMEVRVEAAELDLRPYNLRYDDLKPEWSADDVWTAVKDLSARADLTVRAEFGSLRLTDTTLHDGVFDLALDRRQAALRRLSVREEGGRAIEARLRAPFTVPDGAGGDVRQSESWIARAEAAIDVRPGQAESGGVRWRAGLWDGVLSLETGTPVAGRLSGRLTRTEEHFQWSEVTGRIGKAAIGGQFSWLPGARPVLRGGLSIDRAAVDLAGGTEGGLWPAWPLADFWPRGLDVHLDWSADHLEIAGAPLARASGTAVLETGQARLTLVSGTLYGGAASGTASLKLGPDGAASWEGQGVVQRADLGELMGAGWRGRGLIRVSASGSGGSIAELVSGLRGTLGVNFQDGRIGGFDAAALAASLKTLEGGDAVRAAAENAFGQGATPFRRIEGEAKIRNGEVDLSGISAQTETGPVMLAGVVSLPARLIAAQADISLGDAVEAPLSVQFIGRMEAPERMVDTERLVRRLGE